MKTVLVVSFVIVLWLVVVRTAESAVRGILFPRSPADQTELRAALTGHVVTCFGLLDLMATAVATTPEPLLVFWQ